MLSMMRMSVFPTNSFMQHRSTLMGVGVGVGVIHFSHDQYINIYICIYPNFLISTTSLIIAHYPPCSPVRSSNLR